MSQQSFKCPLVTVVTVVFNGEDFIEETILSVINQKYENIEYIVIDGNSTDKTMEIIEKYRPYITYLVSEKDSGIYDAMNKGIDIANGEWINFMNAGDTFSSASSIADIFSLYQEKFTVIYGDVTILQPNLIYEAKAKMITDIPMGMPFCHQSSLTRTSYHKINKFNISNPIAADMEFFVSAYVSGFQFNYLPFSISNIRSGGVSDSKRIETIFAWWKVCIDYGFPKYLALHYMTLLSSVYFKTMIRNMLPDAVNLKLLRWLRSSC